MNVFIHFILRKSSLSVRLKPSWTKQKLTDVFQSRGFFLSMFKVLLVNNSVKCSYIIYGYSLELLMYLNGLIIGAKISVSTLKVA